MTRCSGQPRDQVFVKGYGFLSFTKNMGRNIDKGVSKTEVVNTARNFMILLQMHLKLLQKEQF